MTRFGALVERVDKKIPGSKLPLLSVSQTRGVIRRSELTGTPGRAESLDHYKTCRAGDIVFNKMSIRAGAMGVAQEAGLVTYHYEVMRPRKGVDARYVVYLMKSEAFTAEMVKRERGIGAGDDSGAVRTTEVPFRVLRTIDTYVPPAVEQRAIADYLDRETAQIDAFIAKNEELITLLTERRAAVIASVIRTSSSGLVQLRHLARIANGGTPPSGMTEYWNGDVPFITPPDLNGADGGEIYTTQRTISDLGIPYSGVAPADSVMLSTRAPIGHVGRIARLSAFNQGCRALIPRDGVNSEYLAFALVAARPELDARGLGTTFLELSGSSLASLRLPLPDWETQLTAAEACRVALARVDEATDIARRSIELARERRAALISAAVTGKIDVGVAV